MATQFGGYTVPSRNYRWQDWVNVVLAVWLFMSPWVLRFAQTAPAGANGSAVAVDHAAWNTWVLAVIVFLVALSALGSIQVWQEYWNLALGAWIFVAPWALGFVGLARASWDHWIVGALIFLVALSGISQLRTVQNSIAPPPAGTRNVPPRGPLT
jgi:SPW repeat